MVKQEMGNIGKDVTEPLSHQETSKAWEKKPESYIIFKDLLKSIFFFFPLFESGIIGRQSKKRHSFAPQDCFWSVWKENGCLFVFFLFFSFFFGACRVGVSRH